MKLRSHRVFIGIDIGTQGIRVIASTETGKIIGTESCQFILSEDLDLRQEQSPKLWWEQTLRLLTKLSNKLKDKIALEQILSISVTSTSGTVIPLDKNFDPLHNALMYSDSRSFQEALLCKEISLNIEKEKHTPYSRSYGLPKIVWFNNNFPEKSEKIYLWCHPSDYIIGKLSNIWGYTDYTNALKTGFNLDKEKWPDYIESHLKLPPRWFPQVLPPGEVIGLLSSDVSLKTNLPNTIKVVAGITDGCASQIAAGSLSPGEWNTTLGTTMVIKGITHNKIHDPLGRLYNHKHPEGYWMPGGASNTGADWISIDFNQYDLFELNKKARTLSPTQLVSYPLKQKGERFPFVCEKARGFDPPNLSIAELYTARLEGVAYLEKLSYEEIEILSKEKVKAIFTAGGGSKSEVWLSIRSNILQKPIYKMEHVEGAFGAAIIAASRTYFDNIKNAGESMLSLSKIIEPTVLNSKYHESYLEFKELLKTKGYLKEG